MASILVVGAGALGGLLGALLMEKGHDALLLSRSHAPPRMRLEGGAYGPDRDVPVQAATSAPDGLRPDLVIVGVKTQDLEAALAQHARAMGDAPVVALQNGLAQDDIVLGAVGPARAVACVVALDATHLDPGRVRCDRPGTLLVGPVRPEAQAAAERAASLLAQVVRVQRVDNVRGARWTKLLVNLQNVIPAITDLSYQEVAAHPQLARAVVRMVREARAVADAEGVTLAPLPWTNPMLLRAMSRMPEALALRFYAARVKTVLGDKPAYGSTWQSVRRGQSVETEWLNGEVARRGLARGVATPVNARAVELAAKGARMSPDECARALLG
ncbi:MAG TPA: 2-dehydropantoate 2-reductase [Candidatus Thermoplasmatota archaeon]|nr:2-dehydropantoate 2-reductase [Candidatus Thermoplasmatota archaeon]